MTYRIHLNPAALRRLGAGDLGGPRGVHLVEAMARIVKDSIVDVMEEAPPRTGHTYLVPGTKTPYTASAPGEPPAVREGRYVAGWDATKGVQAGNRLVAAAVNNVRTEEGELVGVILDEGTSDIVRYKVRMRPRPHIREGMAAARPKIEALIKGAGR